MDWEFSYRRLRWWLAANAVEIRFAQFKRVLKAGFDPDQPRIPAGNPDGGQWAGGGGGEVSGESEATSVESILAVAPRLAASRASMKSCLALCSPLLEAFQPANTTNINYWNFMRCLNACLGK
jgi:hypothetical protein